MSYSKIVFLILFLLISTFNKVLAENWIDTGMYNNIHIFLDMDSIKSDDRFIFYNIKRENSETGECIIITIQSDPYNNFAGIVSQQTYTEFYQKDSPYLLVGQQHAKNLRLLDLNSPIHNANQMARNYLQHQTNIQIQQEQTQVLHQYNNTPSWQDNTNRILNTVNQTNATGQNIINTLNLLRFIF